MNMINVLAPGVLRRSAQDPLSVLIASIEILEEIVGICYSGQGRISLRSVTGRLQNWYDFVGPNRLNCGTQIANSKLNRN